MKYSFIKLRFWFTYLKEKIIDFIITLFQNLVVTGEGDQYVTLTCVILSRPLPNVTWQKGNSNVVENDRIMTTQNNDRYTLVLKNVKKADFGTYTCLGYNILGNDTGTIIVTGKYAFISAMI